MITLITLTGSRPEAFALCQKYLKAQTYKGPIQWIVVHDEKGDFFSGQGSGFEVYRGPRVWEPGLNTQRGNMEEAIKHIKGDVIAFIEDDDLYTPTFLETMTNLLQYCDIAGECNAKYYHIGLPGYKELRNIGHAALCQTVMKRSMLPYLTAAVNSGELYFDAHIWRQVHEKQISSVLLNNTNLVIGMKGLPGREGIGVGHRTKDYLLDPNLSKLKEWCGPYVENYIPLINRIKNERRNTGSTGSSVSTIKRPEGKLPPSSLAKGQWRRSDTKV